MSQASRNIHVIEENQEEPKGVTAAKAQEANEVLKPAEHIKKVPLCDDVPDRKIIIGKGLEQAEEERLI
jgi:hypothetical protein